MKVIASTLRIRIKELSMKNLHYGANDFLDNNSHMSSIEAHQVLVESLSGL